MKRVTLKDLAEKLQLSIATVSRALNNDKNVRKETRDLVARTAAEIGYKRNVAAAQLRHGRAHTVGIIANEITSSFACRVILGVQEVLLDNGIRLIIASSDNDPEKERLNIRKMQDAGIDGLIACPCHNSTNDNLFRELADSSLPLVFYSHAPHEINASKVLANDYEKAYFLLDHIILSGRTRIAHIRGNSSIDNFPDIFRAYREVLEKHRIPFDEKLVVETESTLNGGARAVDHLLDNGIEFDALFAANDLPAVGAMNRLQARGLRVPADVSVAGFSGSGLSKISYPPLTTSEPPLHEMGVRAAELVIQGIDSPEFTPQTVVLNAHIQLRESTHPDNK